MQDYRIYFVMIIVVVILFFLLYCYIINKKSSKYEDKFNSFALPSNDDSKSLFDELSDFLWKIIKFISKKLEISKLLSYHSKQFDKYVTYSDENKINGMYILTIKIVFAFMVFISSFMLSIIYDIDIHYIIILLFTLIAYFVPNMILEIKYVSASKNVANDILTAVIVINGALKNKSTIYEAITLVTKELDGSISEEFSRIKKDLDYGLSLSDAFSRFDERVNLKSTRFISDTVKIQTALNCEFVSIFEYIESMLVDSTNISNEVISETASSRFIYKLVLILPVFALAFVSIFKINLIIDLFINATGFFIFIAIMSLYILYIVLMKMIMQVEL